MSIDDGHQGAPPEIWQMILAFLPAEDLARAARLNNSFQAMAAPLLKEEKLRRLVTGSYFQDTATPAREAALGCANATMRELPGVSRPARRRSIMEDLTNSLLSVPLLTPERRRLSDSLERSPIPDEEKARLRQRLAEQSGEDAFLDGLSQTNMDALSFGVASAQEARAKRQQSGIAAQRAG